MRKVIFGLFVLVVSVAVFGVACGGSPFQVKQAELSECALSQIPEVLKGYSVENPHSEQIGVITRTEWQEKETTFGPEYTDTVKITLYVSDGGTRELRVYGIDEFNFHEFYIGHIIKFPGWAPNQYHLFADDIKLVYKNVGTYNLLDENRTEMSVNVSDIISCE